MWVRGYLTLSLNLVSRFLTLVTRNIVRPPRPPPFLLPFAFAIVDRIQLLCIIANAIGR